MSSTRPDDQNNSAVAYKRTVREYLRTHDEVVSKDDLRAGTDVPAWYIDQIASQDTFYTSVNHQHEYVASKYVVGHRSSHDGFWRPEVDDGVAVFHRKETTKATLKHLAFRRPSGITAPEANDLLDRRCYRPLRKLADQQEIHAAEQQKTTVYVHSWPSLRDAQLSQRETDQPTDVIPDDPDEEGYLYRDELLATFLSVAVSEIQSIPAERAAALVLRQFEGDSFDALERLPQEQLSEYGVEVGSVEETYIFQAIKERMHRHLRAGVERVFSRLKSFTGLDRVRARKENNVETHVVLSAVALVATSLTAKRQGKPGLIRSPSRLI
jgi:hypothetical protein